MADAKTDILARFQLKDSDDAVGAECTLGISPSDALALKRVASPDGAYGGPFTPGSYCLLDSFSFGIQVVDKESAEHQQRMAKEAEEQHGGDHGKPGKAKPKGFDPTKQEFYLWRTMKDTPSAQSEQEILGQLSFKAGQFSLSRRIDCATPVLFQMCCERKALGYVSILKRTQARARAGSGAATLDQISFLRIDFTDVLITGVDWNDGDVVEEKLKFQATKLAMRTMSQDATGKLLAIDGYTWVAKVADTALSAGRSG